MWFVWCVYRARETVSGCVLYVCDLCVCVYLCVCARASYCVLETERQCVYVCVCMSMSVGVCARM